MTGLSNSRKRPLTRLRKPQKRRAASATTFCGRDDAGRALFPPIGVGQSTTPQGARGMALLRTQSYAEKHAQEPGTFYVERQTLFGPSTNLYRVRRHEGGAVSTTVLSFED